MARMGSDIAVFKKVLLKASELCQGNSSATNCSGFMIFDSPVGKRDLLFKDSTKKLVDVGDKNTFRKWLGDEYYNSVQGLTDSCGIPTPTPKSSAVKLGPGSSLVLVAVGALVMRFV